MIFFPKTMGYGKVGSVYGYATRCLKETLLKARSGEPKPIAVAPRPLAGVTQ